MKAQRIDYRFKFLYAIGIIAVVAGHCGNGGISLGYEFFSPAGYHLPLFMFASGYFYDREDENRLGASIWRKCRKLLVPFYLWNLAYGILVLLLRNFGFSIGNEISLVHLTITPLLRGDQFMYNLGSWYVVPLFMIYVFHLCLCRLLGTKKNDLVLLLFYLVLGFGSIYAAWFGQNHGAGLVLIRMGYFLPFYGFGTYYKNHLEGKFKIPNLIYFGVIFGIELLIISKYHGPVSYTYSWCNTFDNRILSYLVPLLGILFWLRIATILEPLLQTWKGMLTIANHTYAIMMHQFLGFMLVKIFFGAVHTFTDGRIFMAFSWEECKSDIWYYYVPGNLMQWFLVYLFAGIAFPIILQESLSWIWKKVAEKRVPSKVE